MEIYEQDNKIAIMKTQYYLSQVKLLRVTALILVFFLSAMIFFPSRKDLRGAKRIPGKNIDDTPDMRYKQNQLDEKAKE